MVGIRLIVCFALLIPYRAAALKLSVFRLMQLVVLGQICMHASLLQCLITSVHGAERRNTNLDGLDIRRMISGYTVFEEKKTAITKTSFFSVEKF